MEDVKVSVGSVLCSWSCRKAVGSSDVMLKPPCLDAEISKYSAASTEHVQSHVLFLYGLIHEVKCFFSSLPSPECHGDER